MILNDDARKVKITDDVLKTILKYRQCEKDLLEAGGVLIGRENISNNNLVIEFASEPMPKDKRDRYNFTRRDKGHIEVYNKLYDKNKGIYVYIGEWHTHPEAIPNYSPLDFRTWKKIGKQANNMHAQYHLIAGCEAWRMWKYSRGFMRADELITMSWKDLLLCEEDYTQN